jgi:hypothetical protein
MRKKVHREIHAYMDILFITKEALLSSKEKMTYFFPELISSSGKTG